MSTPSLIAHQARYDLRVFSRDPRARGFTLAMPVLLLIIFGSIFKNNKPFTQDGYSIGADAYYVPRMIVLGLVGAGLSNLLITLISKRETGALKRRRATPVQPLVLISSDLVTAEVSALSIAIVLTLIGLAFGVHPTGTGVIAILLTVLIGGAALGAIAYALSPFVRSVDSAGPLTTLLLFAVNAISGIYVPESLFPQGLRDVAQILPVRPLAVAMQAAFAPNTNGGSTFAWSDLGIVLLWGIAAAAFAAKRFIWSPSQE